MDTDGYKRSDTYAAHYYSVSEQLADDMMFILRSLWAVVTKSKWTWKYKKNWIEVICQDFYTLYIKHRNPDLLFKMWRKQKWMNVKEVWKSIVSVEELNEEIVWRCITVSNPNWLYITDDFIVTHNSFLWVMWLWTQANQYAGTRWFMWRKELIKMPENGKLFADIFIVHVIGIGNHEQRIIFF